MDINDLLRRITSKGDVAAASIGFVIGYLLDVSLASHGIPPATGGGLGAVGALGLKNSVHAAWQEKEQRERLKLVEKGARDEVERVEGMQTEERQDIQKKCLEVKKLIDGRDIVKVDVDLEEESRCVLDDIDLWERRLMEDSQILENLASFVQRYRDARRSKRSSVAAPGSMLLRQVHQKDGSDSPKPS